MQGYQPLGQAHATRWENGFELRGLQPEEFLNRVAVVGEILDFKGVPEDRRVSLVETKLINEDLSLD
jgi:hypothetical protein